jgi:predicted nuclease of predicted toxin-antitoxin system
MRFLLDMNLPPALAEQLHAEGHDAIVRRLPPEG